VLSDPEKRKKYDQYGKDWQHAEQFEKAQKNQKQSSGSFGTEESGTQFESDFSNILSSCLVEKRGPVAAAG